jgi:hypothetical protein
MDREIKKAYLDCKEMLEEFYKNVIDIIKSIETSNEDEVNIKNQFLEQLTRFRPKLKIKYSPEDEKFVEKIEEKTRKYIIIRDGDLTDELRMIKFYNLRIIEDICDFYRNLADKYSDIQY